MIASVQLVEQMLREVGPGRFLIVADAAPWTVDLRRRGCIVELCSADALAADVTPEAIGRFDTVVIGVGAIAQMGSAKTTLLRLRGLTGRFVVVVDEPVAAQPAPPRDAAHWVRAAIQAGLRRSPTATRPVRTAVDAALPPFVVFEVATAQCPAPLANCHGDVGEHADRSLHAYSLVATWVRPGDHVLVLGGRSAAAAVLLAARTSAQRVTLVEEDAGLRAHARALDAARYGIEIRPDVVGLLPACIDMIVCLDTPSGSSALSQLRMSAPALKPDGRVIAAAHQAQVQELIDGLSKRFLLEARFVQHGDTDDPTLVGVALEAAANEPGLHLIVASANPLLPYDRAPYSHAAFDVCGTSAGAVANFGAHYDNPWLYRAMVQMGERIRHPGLLRALAAETLNTARADSADFGAAATVLGYQALAAREFELTDSLLTITEAYCRGRTENPHVLRWQISLAYVAALMCLEAGRRDQARTLFAKVAARDPIAFSPLLATKTVAANFWLGVLALVDGDRAGAQLAWQAGVQAGAAALRCAGDGTLGRCERPLPFGFQELAEVADMSSQCAAALTHLDHFAVRPGRFWEAVDTRRFGLASWCLHLERENERLRGKIEQLHGGPAALARPPIADGLAPTAAAA